MSTKEDFGFEKLNRIPKKIIQGAIEEFRKKNPGCALNRMELCFIVSEHLEKSYLKADASVESSIACECLEKNSLETSVHPENDGDKKKKNYNGQHILKKMGLDTTKKILRKIDFYIYKYYSQKK